MVDSKFQTSRVYSQPVAGVRKLNVIVSSSFLGPKKCHRGQDGGAATPATRAPISPWRRRDNDNDNDNDTLRKVPHPSMKAWPYRQE